MSSSRYEPVTRFISFGPETEMKGPEIITSSKKINKRWDVSYADESGKITMSASMNIGRLKGGHNTFTTIGIMPASVRRLANNNEAITNLTVETTKGLTPKWKGMNVLTKYNPVPQADFVEVDDQKERFSDSYKAAHEGNHEGNRAL
jgi:hypothetical protein